MWQTTNGAVQFRGYLDLCHGFTCPPNADKNTYFTSTNPFEITELEVFRIVF